MKTRSAAAGSQQPPAKADFDGAEETPAATAAEAPVEAPAAPSSSAAAPLAAIRKFLNRLPRRTKRRRRFDIGEPQLLEAQQPAAAEIPAARPDHPDLGAGGEAGNRLGTRAPPPSSQVVTFAESSLPKRLAGFSGASVTAAAPNSSASAVSTSAAAPAPELLPAAEPAAASSPVAAQPTGPAEDSDGIASPSATADAEEAGAPVALRSGGANAARKLNGQKRSLAARKARSRSDASAEAVRSLKAAAAAKASVAGAAASRDSTGATAAATSPTERSSLIMISAALRSAQVLAAGMTRSLCLEASSSVAAAGPPPTTPPPMAERPAPGATSCCWPSGRSSGSAPTPTGLRPAWMMSPWACLRRCRGFSGCRPARPACCSPRSSRSSAASARTTWPTGSPSTAT
ncbi:hypothetical protein BOX15_Mlig009524g2 [Macrostomum lignano]|uniref:Uncharacterized protein n=1 Tax=Macrostomum lignano TaxID=282301 RepID=A0A267DL38_9PLAT|nr:hypothetical protein BOX15_Mlig009524g2 [Macrostomum lignano]